MRKQFDSNYESRKSNIKLRPGHNYKLYHNAYQEITLSNLHNQVQHCFLDTKQKTKSLKRLFVFCFAKPYDSTAITALEL